MCLGGPFHERQGLWLLIPCGKQSCAAEQQRIWEVSIQVHIPSAVLHDEHDWLAKQLATGRVCPL